MNEASPTAPDPLLLSARNCVASGDTAGADANYRRALDAPHPAVRAEAARYFAQRAFRAGDLEAASRWSAQVTELLPDDGPAWLNHGVTLQARGAHEAALSAFAQALRLDSANAVAALCLGEELAACGRREDAASTLLRAILQAQFKGQWRTRETTPPALLPRVTRAMDFVDSVRADVFGQVIDGLIAEFGGSELPRLRKMLAGYLGKPPIERPDARQQPKFLFVPDLPTMPFFPLELFPWREEFEDQAAAVRTELFEAITTRTGLQPFHDGAQLQHLVRGGDTDGSWDAVFFYRHGTRFDANLERAPVTASLLERIPRVDIRDHGPEMLFSLLRPGAHILPHRGVTNSRAVAHLPLVVPPDCALHVLGEPPHAWQEGRVMVFDDTFEHEAWNRSGQLRAILLMDTWNPWLGEAERIAITRLVEAIGDFRIAGERITERC